MILSPKTLAIAIALLLFGGLERGWPFVAGRIPVKGLVANGGLAIFNLLAASGTTAMLLTWVWAHPFGAALLQQGSAKSWPFVVGFLIAVLSLDLLMYGWHWLMHNTAWGWRVHAVHHSDRLLTTLTAYRFHPLEVLPSSLPKIALIWLLGISPGQWLLYESLYAVELLFQHSNWAMSSRSDRFLSQFIVTPNYHRLHHSIEQQQQRSNYASFLTLWDWIFRTGNYPKSPQKLVFGVTAQCSIQGMMKLLLMPFEMMKTER